MKLRPMNKTLIIECEGMELTDLKHEAAEAIREGLIILPEKNMTEKRSPYAKVIRASDDCEYPYLKNQRICYNQFAEDPVWYDEDGKRYRIIKEWNVRWVYES